MESAELSVLMQQYEAQHGPIETLPIRRCVDIDPQKYREPEELPVYEARPEGRAAKWKKVIAYIKANPTHDVFMLAEALDMNVDYARQVANDHGMVLVQRKRVKQPSTKRAILRRAMEAQEGLATVYFTEKYKAAPTTVREVAASIGYKLARKTTKNRLTVVGNNILRLHRKHPLMKPTDIADALKCSAEYVRRTIRNNR